MSFWDCLPHLPSLALAGSSQADNSVDLLLLGTGWTGGFLLPAASEKGLRTASTTRNGGSGTIAWTFDPDSDDSDSFRVLPDAKTILIVFPMYEEAVVDRLITGYLKSRTQSDARYYADEKLSTEPIEDIDTKFILLGSTGIYREGGPTFAPLFAPGQQASPDLRSSLQAQKKVAKPSPWADNTTEPTPVPRAIAENRLLSFNEQSNAIRDNPIDTAVLELCGLWGHGRSVRNYMSRLPASKEAFRNLAAINMVHGRDVARAVLAMQDQFEKAAGKRWILTNQRTYDLWELASQFGSAGEAGRNHPPTGPFPQLVTELLGEPGCPARSLPRSAEVMFEMTDGRSLSLDGREFWATFGLSPEVGWVD